MSDFTRVSTRAAQGEPPRGSMIGDLPQLPARAPRTAARSGGRRDGFTARASVRHWRVRTKLIAVLVIPTVAFLVLAGLNTITSLQNANAFAQRADAAELARSVTALAHNLQLERDLTAGFMTVGGQGGQADPAALTAQQASVGRTLAAYRTAEEPLRDSLDAVLGGRLDASRAALDQLGAIREAASGRALTRPAVFNEYTQTIATLLDINDALAQQSENEAFAQNARAFSDLSRAKEAAAQVRGTLYAIGLRGGFAFGEFQDFADLLATRDAALAQFRTSASEQQQAGFDNVVQGQAVLAVARIEATAVNRQSNADLTIDPAQWLAASTTQVELLRDVETGLLDGVVVQAQDLAAAARRDTLVTVLVIAAILAVALAASLLVAQSMARSLRRLQRAALDVAGSQLPAAVEQLRTTRTGQLELSVAPVGIDSRDEIGEVAGAFDTVHREAVRLASEQAALRRSINDMFVNLARRNQTLIDRQLNMIEDLEHDTEDPSELEELFGLDHLATRMRRNQENLLVLANADPATAKGSAQYTEPAPLGNLLREALAEVEDYRRVELLTSDDAPVIGYATSDVVHLLAELIENATMFSPPDTPVRIASQSTANGYMVEIEDQGTGMSDDDLLEANQRLAQPPAIDFALSRRLGFFVVGRLAQRHGIRVQLRRSWYGGVTALVLLPDRVFQPEPVPLPVGAPSGHYGAATMDFPASGRGPAPAERPPAFATGEGFATDGRMDEEAWADEEDAEYVGRAAALARVSRAAQRFPGAPAGPRPSGPAAAPGGYPGPAYAGPGPAYAGGVAAFGGGRGGQVRGPLGGGAGQPIGGDRGPIGGGGDGPVGSSLSFGTVRQHLRNRWRQQQQNEPPARQNDKRQNEEHDPLANYRPGLVQGRLAADLDPPPPLSSPLAEIRREAYRHDDDGASW